MAARVVYTPGSVAFYASKEALLQLLRDGAISAELEVAGQLIEFATGGLTLSPQALIVLRSAQEAWQGGVDQARERWEAEKAKPPTATRKRKKRRQ